MSLSFSKLSAYYAALDELMHIGTMAVQAASTGQDPNGAVAKLAAHLAAYTATVDSVGAILIPTGQAIKQVINDVKTPAPAVPTPLPTLPAAAPVSGTVTQDVHTVVSVPNGQV